MARSPTVPLKGVSPAALEWLAGSWLGRNRHDPVEEHLELDRPDARWTVYRREDRHRLVSYFARENESVTETGVFEYARE